MTEEMKKIETLTWMFHHLSSDQLESLKNMARAMSERPDPQPVIKQPPLND